MQQDSAGKGGNQNLDSSSIPPGFSGTAYILLEIPGRRKHEYTLYPGLPANLI